MNSPQTGTYSISETAYEINKINFEGNVIPHSWYKKITFDSGRPDFPAITILAEIIYWYRPFQALDAEGNLTFCQKFTGEMLQANAAFFATKLGMTKEQARTAIQRLDEAGLIARELRTVVLNAGQDDEIRLYNTQFIRPIPEAILHITHPNFDPPLDRQSIPEPNPPESADTSFSVVTRTAVDSTAFAALETMTNPNKVEDFLSESEESLQAFEKLYEESRRDDEMTAAEAQAIGLWLTHLYDDAPKTSAKPDHTASISNCTVQSKDDWVSPKNPWVQLIDCQRNLENTNWPIPETTPLSSGNTLPSEPCQSNIECTNQGNLPSLLETGPIQLENTLPSKHVDHTNPLPSGNVPQEKEKKEKESTKEKERKEKEKGKKETPLIPPTAGSHAADGSIANPLTGQTAKAPVLPLFPEYSAPTPKITDADFEEFWKLYPKRAGSNPKGPALKLWKARVKAGHAPATILAGTQRYAAYCKATGKIGTEYVKHARTFLSQEEFLSPWNLPVTERRPFGRSGSESVGYDFMAMAGSSRVIR